MRGYKEFSNDVTAILRSLIDEFDLKLISDTVHFPLNRASSDSEKY